MASWPGTLPLPQGIGYQVAPVEQTVRTDMESGSARMRRRTAARNDKVTITWRMSDAQMAIFRAWFDDAATGIAGGAVWFTVALRLGTGGATTVEARFTKPFQAAFLPGSNWAVSGEIEVR